MGGRGCERFWEFDQERSDCVELVRIHRGVRVSEREWVCVGGILFDQEGSDCV